MNLSVIVKLVYNPLFSFSVIFFLVSPVVTGRIAFGLLFHSVCVCVCVCVWERELVTTLTFVCIEAFYFWGLVVWFYERCAFDTNRLSRCFWNFVTPQRGCDQRRVSARFPWQCLFPILTKNTGSMNESAGVFKEIYFAGCLGLYFLPLKFDCSVFLS